ncbi:MAG: hypothetical protein ACQEQV_04405 [Fibrobacterota bacterium]
MRQFLVMAAGVLILVGCSTGPTMDDISAAQEQVKEYQAQGIPDSIMQPAESAVRNAANARRQGSGSAAKEHYDKAMALLEKAEKARAAAAEQIKPELIADMESLQSRAEQKLKGLHKDAFDESVADVQAVIDSGRIYAAQKQFSRLEEQFSSLIEQQKHAEEIRPEIYGTWVFRDTAENKEHPEVDAVTEKVIKFHKNGRASFRNKKDGQTGKKQKMYYHFLNSGDFALKGDTVQIMVDSFQRFKKQVFVKKGDKWVAEVREEPMKEKITDGSQDMSVTYKTLRLDYSKQ